MWVFDVGDRKDGNDANRPRPCVWCLTWEIPNVLYPEQTTRTYILTTPAYTSTVVTELLNISVKVTQLLRVIGYIL